MSRTGRYLGGSSLLMAPSANPDHWGSSSSMARSILRARGYTPSSETEPKPPPNPKVPYRNYIPEKPISPREEFWLYNVLVGPDRTRLHWALKGARRRDAPAICQKLNKWGIKTYSGRPWTPRLTFYLIDLKKLLSRDL